MNSDMITGLKQDSKGFYFDTPTGPVYVEHPVKLRVVGHRMTSEAPVADLLRVQRQQPDGSWKDA